MSELERLHRVFAPGCRIRLLKDSPLTQHDGTLICVRPAGEIWRVIDWDDDDPGIVWLRRADGERETWDCSIEEWFAPVDVCEQ